MKREYGIDAIRIFAMMLVIVGHIIGVGGVLKASVVGSSQYYAALFLQVGTMCSIDIFGLISGYVGYGRKLKPANIVKLWLRVVFWTILILFGFVLFTGTAITKEILKHTFLPVISQTYWYITAYFIVWIFSPFLNIIVEKVRNMILTAGAVLTVIGLTTVISTSGNNAAWLLLLYTIGAIIRKSGIGRKFNIKQGIIGFVMCIMLTYGAVILQELGVVGWNRYLWSLWGGRRDGLWPSSITMLMAAMFILFIGINMKTKERINEKLKKITHLILSVYLIHAHPLVFTLIKDAFSGLAKINWIAEIFGVIGISIIIFTVCIFLDFWRNRLFTFIEVKMKMTS